MLGKKNLTALNPNRYEERDLSCSYETPRDSIIPSIGDENATKNAGAATVPAAPTKSLRRSFSWGKKKREKGEKRGNKSKKRAPPEEDLAEPEQQWVQERVRFNDFREVSIERQHADSELGFDVHSVTGEVVVSYVGPNLMDEKTVEVGDRLVCIQGVDLDELPERKGNGIDALEAARYILSGEGDYVELLLERNCIRTELLKRVDAALRGTSLDRLGLTLVNDGNSLWEAVITGVEGLAAKSGRLSVGDRLVAVNGEAANDFETAVTLLQNADADCRELELEVVYGYHQPKETEFDPISGTFVPAKKPETALKAVRRSLSFGKKKKAASKEPVKEPPKNPYAASSDPIAVVEESWETVPELLLEPRYLTIAKNDDRMIAVTFRPHEVTGELITALVAEGGPAHQAGVEVGDHVLAVQGYEITAWGDDAVLQAKDILQSTADLDTVELLVQTNVRTEVLEFGAEVLGGPKTKLGLSFYSFDGDNTVRITKVAGAAAKTGRFALGDRIVSMNGIRVNHAQTLSDHIAQACLTSEYVEFEIALGYAANEGLWYGKEGEASSATTPRQSSSETAGAPRKAKRSFSFGKKPRH